MNRVYGRRFGGAGIRRGLRSRRGGSATPLTVSPDATGWLSADVYTPGSGSEIETMQNLANPGDGDVTQGVASQRPDTVLIPPRVARFDSALTQYLESVAGSDLVPASGSCTVYLAASFSTFAANHVAINLYGVAGAGYVRFRAAGGELRLQIDTTAGLLQVAHTYSDTGLHVWTGRYNAATGLGQVELDDGGVVADATLGAGLTVAADRWALGAANGGGVPHDGDIVSVVIIPRAVTGAEHNKQVALAMKAAGI